MKEFKVSFLLSIFSLLLILVPAGLGIYVQWSKMNKDFGTAGEQLTLNKSTKISEMEKKEIEAWIMENDLNIYGDPKNTVYTGGTPLFNEATGQKIDRFEYILKRHPDKPWQK